MTRIGVVFIVVFTLLGVLAAMVYFRPTEQAKFGTQLGGAKKDDDRAFVVYALRDIAEGETITADAIELGEIAPNQIPSGVCFATFTASGKKARYGLAKGQIVSLHDLRPYPPGYMYPAVEVVKEIRAGTVIKSDEVQDTELPKWESDLPKSSMVIGKKARQQMSPGTLLEKSDIMP